MRLRKKPDAINVIEAQAHYYPVTAKTFFDATTFVKKQPLHIEIGMGKGDFIIGMAKKYPHINFIGIERYDSVLAVAMTKLDGIQLDNLRLILFDANNIAELFDVNTVDHIYLNFSDPWPKKRHTKRRLTSPSFLKQYDRILISKGKITQKSDNQSLIEYSISSLANHGYNFLNVSLDLHTNKSLLEHNVMTEYERKFSEKGFRIYQVEVAKYD